MSESKLVIPTRCEDCEHLKSKYVSLHDYDGINRSGSWHKCKLLDNDFVRLFPTHEKTFDNCPLQPITPNSNVESALEVLLNSLKNGCEIKYVDGTLYYIKENNIKGIVPLKLITESIDNNVNKELEIDGVILNLYEEILKLPVLVLKEINGTKTINDCDKQQNLIKNILTTSIKKELSKIPALEKEVEDKEILIKIKDNVNEQLSSTLNAIEELIKKSRYKKAQEIIKNLPFIDDKDLKYVISPAYSMEEIEQILNRSDSNE